MTHNYQVTARKFRPQSFIEFVGQKHITQTLINALNSDRFPHALLLTGPRGTGKTTTARILAKTLLCQNKINSNPCNQCQSCLELKEGSHLDVIEIDGASNNGVDHIRDLKNSIGYRPVSGLYKIYIIDEVHMLSTSAFNALLKTLEEPPNHIVFVFATTEVQKIPLTILSRCQRFDFRNHSLTDIKNNLQKICENENINFEEKALWILAKQAKGSIRDSLTFLDQLASFGDGSLNLDSVMTVLGLTDRHILLKLLKALNSKDNGLLIETTKDLKESGLDPFIFSEEFLEVLRDCRLVKTDHQKNLQLSEDEASELRNLSSNLSTNQIHLLFDTVLTELQKFHFTNDPLLALEMLLFKLMGLQPHQAMNVQKNQTRQTEREMEKGLLKKERVGEKPKYPPAPSLRQEGNENNRQGFLEKKSFQSSSKGGKSKNTSFSVPEKKPVGRKWEDFVHAVKQVNGFLGALLEHTFILKKDEKMISLALPEKMSFLMNKLEEKKNRERTENFLKTFWSDNRQIEVKVLKKNDIMENFSPKEINEKEKIKKGKDESNHISAHPLVQETEEVFKDRIKRTGLY